MRLSPTAEAAIIKARWESDLSPGAETSPVNPVERADIIGVAPRAPCGPCDGTFGVAAVIKNTLDQRLYGRVSSMFEPGEIGRITGKGAVTAKRP